MWLDCPPEMGSVWCAVVGTVWAQSSAQMLLRAGATRVAQLSPPPAPTPLSVSLSHGFLMRIASLARVSLPMIEEGRPSRCSHLRNEPICHSHNACQEPGVMHGMQRLSQVIWLGGTHLIKYLSPQSFASCNTTWWTKNVRRRPNRGRGQETLEQCTACEHLEACPSLLTFHYHTVPPIINAP